MSFILEDAAGRSIRVNSWNWGVLHHAVAQAALLDPVVWEPARFNAGASLTPAEVKILGEFLRESVLPRIPEGGRLTHDLNVTTTPDDGTFHREKLELNYSLQIEVLRRIIAFLDEATGEVRVL